MRARVRLRRRVLGMRVLASIYNRLPHRLQRRILRAAHPRFLVGVVGLGVDPAGRILLARHRFGSPRWRMLGGMLARDEPPERALEREIREETGLDVEIGPLLSAAALPKLGHLELVYAYRVRGGAFGATGEVSELRAFPLGELPDLRGDQRAIVDRHAADVLGWAKGSS